MHPERQAFEQAILEDRYDELTRRIFADWLEDHGHDDEAIWHRSWSREWQESVDWIHSFATKAGRTCVEGYAGKSGDDVRWVEITYEMVMEAAANWIATGEYFTQLGSEGLCDTMHTMGEKEFWRHYQIASRTAVPETEQGEVFSCSC